MTEASVKSFNLASKEMAYLFLEKIKLGDKVVMIKEGLDISVYVNNTLFARGSGRIPAFLDDVNKEFNGSFLGETIITEDGRADFTFYPRFVRFDLQDNSQKLLEESSGEKMD